MDRTKTVQPLGCQSQCKHNLLNHLSELPSQPAYFRCIYAIRMFHNLTLLTLHKHPVTEKINREYATDRLYNRGTLTFL